MDRPGVIACFAAQAQPPEAAIHLKLNFKFKLNLGIHAAMIQVTGIQVIEPQKWACQAAASQANSDRRLPQPCHWPTPVTAGAPSRSRR